MKYILSLDQGTTSSRAILFDKTGSIIAMAQKEFEQIFPKPGWVEHNPDEIWDTQLSVARSVLSKSGLDGKSIAAIGITNQRETTVLWNRKTGKPVYNAIVWQDRRTAEYCDKLKLEGKSELFQKKTGLVLDAYFSGTKIRWLLDNVKGAREMAEKGELAFGTIDTWLTWKLTGGKAHVTDVSNASRTLLFNIHQGKWDDELLGILDIPRNLLPEVCSSSEIYGHVQKDHLQVEIPIAGIAGDQQAALFGQVCTEAGMVKNTYGTGCFMLMNTGSTPIPSKHQLLTTVAWKLNDQTTYALEGSVFVGGAVVQWLRDGLGIIQSTGEVETLAEKVDDNGGVYLVPALVGLGAPYWDPYARGVIIGLTRGSNSSHIARAALESIAFQSYDLLQAMQEDSGITLKELRVDGGATANNLLMQFQSDLLTVPVIRPVISETTALGAAYLAGLATGYWDNLEIITRLWQVDNRFQATMDRQRADSLIDRWHDALDRSRDWEKQT